MVLSLAISPGSRFEFHNYRKKDFTLFTKECFPTDDSIMSLAVAKAVLDYKTNGANLSEAAVQWMQKIGRPYPACGFGGNFFDWIYSDHPKPYNSFGNGAAMQGQCLRICCGHIGRSSANE